MCDKFKEPSECSESELENFYQMALKGEQVVKAGLRGRIENAKLLAFHYERDTLVGVAALKKPSEDYKQRVFRKAGVPEEVSKYNCELGWAFTEKKYRGKGIGSGLVQKIIDKFGFQNIYATTKTDNKSAKRILGKSGFRAIGQPYQGTINRRSKLQLFIRPKE